MAKWDESACPLAALDRCLLNTGAFACIGNHSGGGGVKWPSKGGARLTEVATWAGLTVLYCCHMSRYEGIYLFALEFYGKINTV